MKNHILLFSYILQILPYQALQQHQPGPHLTRISCKAHSAPVIGNIELIILSPYYKGKRIAHKLLSHAKEDIEQRAHAMLLDTAAYTPTASASYCPNDYRENGVYTYDDARDREGVVEIFKNNRSLLTRGGEEHEQQVSSHQFVATYIAGNSTYITKVYRMHGTVVGFISYMQLNAATGHIGGLAVDARYRKRGIARELFRHAVHYFQARRIPEIKIALLKSNTEARKVYERFGFTYQGEMMGTMYVYTYRVCTPSLQKKL